MVEQGQRHWLRHQRHHWRHPGQPRSWTWRLDHPLPPHPQSAGWRRGAALSQPRLQCGDHHPRARCCHAQATAACHRFLHRVAPHRQWSPCRHHQRQRGAPHPPRHSAASPTCGTCARTFRTSTVARAGAGSWRGSGSSTPNIQAEHVGPVEGGKGVVRGRERGVCVGVLSPGGRQGWS